MSHPRLPMPAWIAGIASLVLAATVGAQTPATGTNRMGSNNATAKATAESVSSGDRKFMEKAAMGGMAEVELGNLAKEKAANAQVKEFGAKMVQDHGKAGDELKQLASSKGVALPTTMGAEHKREMDKLGKLSGDKFDREYMAHMVKDHKQDVKEFQKAAKESKDADVKAFAAKTLTVVEGHLQLAEHADVSGNTANLSGNAPAVSAKGKQTSTQAGTAPR